LKSATCGGEIQLRRRRHFSPVEQFLTTFSAVKGPMY